MTILVVACPHALGLAIPLVIAISTTLSARNGILVRDRLALERARELNTVVFDKTGTLTRGEQGLVDLADGAGAGRGAGAGPGGGRRGGQRAPPGPRASSRRRASAGWRFPRCDGVRGPAGARRPGRVDGRSLQVGGPRCWSSASVTVPAALAATARLGRARPDGGLPAGGRPAGSGRLRPGRRDPAGERARRSPTLQRQGVRVVMLTGD